MRPHPFIEFADDNTFVDKTWGKELCRQLAPLGVHWFTETDISVADDPELLDLMRAAGCRQVLIGLESPAGRAAGRHRSAIELQGAHGRRLSRRVAPHSGARHHGQRLLHPRPRRTHAADLRARCSTFAREVPLYDVQITVLTAFPARRSTTRLLREGRILEPGTVGSVHALRRELRAAWNVGARA